MTKRQRVLDYLKNTRNGITSLEAINMFGATRLSALIYVFKKKGYIITDRYEKCVDRFGNIVPYKRYWIIGSVYDGK